MEQDEQDPEVRISVAQKDQRVVGDNEYSDSEDEGDDRRNEQDNSQKMEE
jgi:hypothetical protein